ncbi:DNA-directed RNA polymerase subunit beta [Vagococcus coleopterorum]|uniref:DNA-directed RNA polymerase subunit beta n=1 Tax=Vagococcus coleopterorum TaxID=2714946 RepID=A0A6G8ANL8_9ENTE|nr:DNA-directed RNA polymerase subunit beta [Vagococcus coleopterorum]QIL46671.1 DNA-directed RNA polymerase subunit beta [Vagococcus coleopterorum]
MESSKKYILKQLFKIVLIILVALLLFSVGLMIGYGVLGKGNPFDVFNGSTWSHITDFIK